MSDVCVLFSKCTFRFRREYAWHGTSENAAYVRWESDILGPGFACSFTEPSAGPRQCRYNTDNCY